MRCALLAVSVLLFSPNVSAQKAMDPVLLARFKEFESATKALDAAKVATFYVPEMRAEVQQYVKATPAFSDISSKVVEAATGGDIGFIVGRFSYPSTTKGRESARGDFVQIWKRVGGQWLIEYSMFRDDPTITKK